MMDTSASLIAVCPSSEPATTLFGRKHDPSGNSSGLKLLSSFDSLVRPAVSLSDFSPSFDRFSSNSFSSRCSTFFLAFPKYMLRHFWNIDSLNLTYSKTIFQHPISLFLSHFWNAARAVNQHHFRVNRWPQYVLDFLLKCENGRDWQVFWMVSRVKIPYGMCGSEC